MNLTRRHHLVGMSRGGRLLFEIRDMPDLLGVDPRTDSLYFVHPEAEAPNRWLVTHLDP